MSGGMTSGMTAAPALQVYRALRRGAVAPYPWPDGSALDCFDVLLASSSHLLRDA
jgi:hypothetical protein